MARKRGAGTALVASITMVLISLANSPIPGEAQSGTVPIFLDPPRIAVKPGEITPVSVKVDASGQPVDTVQVFLDFDPSLLQAVDDAGEPASKVSFGPVIYEGEWKQPLMNQVDNSAGRIAVAAGKGPPSSDARDLEREFVLAVVNFKGIGEGAEARITVDLEDMDTPLRSKAFSGGVEVTGEGSGATIRINSADNPAASAQVASAGALPSVAAGPDSDSPLASSPNASLAPTAQGTPAAAVTPLAPRKPERNTGSDPVDYSSEGTSPGIGVVSSGIITGVIIIAAVLSAGFYFGKIRQSRRPGGTATPFP